MQFNKRRLSLLTMTAVCVSLSGNATWSQTSGSMTIVVPFSAGGPQDTVARLLTERVGRVEGRTILIDNRPGAATAIGTEAVSRAAPDGNSLLITGVSFVFTPHMRRVKYEPLASFEPICALATFPTVILVHSASPYRTLSELVDGARDKPGGLTFASLGPATPEQVAFEGLKRQANLNMTFVPYPGYAPAVSALLGEHVTAVLADYSSSAQQVAAGKLRVLASLSPTRMEALPDVPTMAELGYKDIELVSWSGLFAPANTPKETLARLARWFTDALTSSDMRTRLVGQGFFPLGVCGSEFSTIVRKQYEAYGRRISELNFKVE